MQVQKLIWQHRPDKMTCQGEDWDGLGTAAAEATLSPVPPNNQKGLDGYPDSMAPQTPTQVQEPEQQEATQEAKPCLSQLVAG